MITIDAVKELISKVPEMTISGHPFLDQRWTSEGHDKRNSHYRRPYYRFCQALVRAIQPKLVVELGIDEGDCSGHFASGNQDTQVIGVDVHKDWEYPSQRCRQMEKQFQNFKYLRGWTWDMVDEVKKYGQIDLFFLDSWHEYEYAALDYNLYAPLLADNHIMLIDDLHMGGVAKIYHEIPAKSKHVDTTMNPSIPFGILIGIDRNYKFQHKKMDFMP